MFLKTQFLPIAGAKLIFCNNKGKYFYGGGHVPGPVPNSLFLIHFIFTTTLDGELIIARFEDW